jgi:hypothetical protein
MNRSSIVCVRRATLDDRPSVFAFIKQAYQGRWEFKIPHRWHWEFVNNPFLASSELPIWIAVTKHGTVVGQACALMEPLKIGESILKLGWGVDFYVDCALRGQGIGRRLRAAYYDAQELSMTLKTAKITRKITSSLGAVPIEPVTRYVRRDSPELRSAAELPNSGYKWALRGGAILRRLCCVKRVKAAPSLAASSRKFVITPVQSFGKELDTLWNLVSPNFDGIIKRDHVYLNWKYVQQPHIQYRRYLARRNGSLCGYVIVREGSPPEPRIGIIADLFVAPDDHATIFALIDHAITEFQAAGITVAVAATSVGAYQQAFERLGFSKTGGEIPLIGSNRMKDIVPLAQTSRWCLGRGDHDWDQYPLAKVY